MEKINVLEGAKTSYLFRWVSTIHGQITAVILACLVIAFVLGSTLENWVRDEYSAPDLEDISARVSVIALLLTDAAPDERGVILDAANRSSQNFFLKPLSYFYNVSTSSADEPFLQIVVDKLLPPEDNPAPFGGWRTFVDGKRVLAAQVDEKTLVVTELLAQTFLRNDVLSFGSNYLVAMITLIILFSVFAVRAITSPLRRIASAAMNADISIGPAIFEERGSVEIIALARALNNMQHRISTMLEARTRMLRGISHDLLTPLTRLRLRAERITDGEDRQSLLGDIDRIERLLKESLGYLRDNHLREAPHRVDLASVLQTVCHEFSDMGHDVRYNGPDHLVAGFKPLALTRAITNLCENAVKYGDDVEVELSIARDFAIIDVKDNGPGIPDEYRSRVLEPFFKIDAARVGSGFGLGLSIVAEIAQAHNAKLELLAREPRGLIVRFALPIGDLPRNTMLKVGWGDPK